MIGGDIVEKYSFNDNIIYRRKGEVVYAFNNSNGEVYEFNDSGGRVLELLTKNISISELLDTISSEYDIDRNDIHDDVNEIIERLLKLGIIE